MEQKTQQKKNLELKTDVNTLSLAYEDSRDQETKYRIALFCSNLKEEVKLSEAEKESVINMELEQGLIEDEKEPKVRNFPETEPEKDTQEARKLRKEENKLRDLEKDLYEAYTDFRTRDARNHLEVRYSPKSSLIKALGPETAKRMEERQENGHPLDQ